MKYTLLSVAVLSCIGVNAQQTLPEVKIEHAVGIETAEPRATLDVNGDTRIQTIEDCTDCEYVLVTGSNNIIQKVALSEFIAESANSNQAIGGADLGIGTTAGISDKKQYIISFEHEGQEKYGIINNSTNKIRVTIPYNNGNGASYNEAVSRTMTEATAAADGVAAPIELKIERGTLAEGSGKLIGEISTPNEYRVKQLAPGEQLKIADLKYTVGNATRTVTLMAIGAIPDRAYGTITDGELRHQFLYLPVEGPDGKTWLNQNLGAAYADSNSPDFDPFKVVTDKNDGKAWGALMRPAEHIEDRYVNVDWMNPTKEYSYTTYNATYPATNKNAKYNGEHICPVGYRIPTPEELATLKRSTTEGTTMVLPELPRFNSVTSIALPQKRLHTGVRYLDYWVERRNYGPSVYKDGQSGECPPKPRVLSTSGEYYERENGHICHLYKNYNDGSILEIMEWGDPVTGNWGSYNRGFSKPLAWGSIRCIKN